MKRREFITCLAGAAVAWPLTGRAQQAGMPVIGFLHSASPEGNAKRLAAFLNGLKEFGFVEGQNVAIEYRWAMAQNEKLPALVADLIRRRVSVIATPGSTPASIAAKKASTSIPIVFATGGDPVELGLVASLNRPGGNATGITSLNGDLAAKRFAVVRQLLPQATHFFALVNPTSQLAKRFVTDLNAGAGSLGIHVDVLHASSDGEIEAAFASLPIQSGTVLIFSPDAFFYTRRPLIASLAMRHAVPTVFDVREYVDDGGLISYGTDFLSVMQLAGKYTSRILKGEKPADLPVMQAEKFELVINLKIAKALGIAVPPSLLAITDDVVE